MPLRRLWASLRNNPSTIMPLVMILTGLEAMILGDHVSRAFTDLGGGPVIRILGIAMFTGGVIVLTGIMRADPVLEPIGLSLSAVGCVLYGAGVIAGLGLNGVIAGQLALGIATFFVLKVWCAARKTV